jgi:hypothetical protein
MLYWLWRIRVKKTLQGIVSSSMSATAESAR